MLPCRLIIDPPLSGAWNMALDEAILEQAANQGVATLRFYQWETATLSLGYFQPHQDRLSHAESRDCPVVRRHSGGGAIIHDRELTYSLALPATRRYQRDPHALYLAVHQSLRDTLLSTLADRQSISIDLCPQAIPPLEGLEPFLCFQRRAQGDLLVESKKNGFPQTIDDAHKVAGSSQRKQRGAVLQHGSILLDRSANAPQLPGMSNLASSGLSAQALISAWTPGLASILDLGIEESGPGEVLLERAQQIHSAKFSHPDWTRRR